MIDVGGSYDAASPSGSFEDDDVELADILCQANLISEQAKKDPPRSRASTPRTSADVLTSAAAKPSTPRDSKPSTPSSSKAPTPCNSKPPTPSASAASLNGRAKENIQTISRAKNRVHTKVAHIAATKQQRIPKKAPPAPVAAGAVDETIHALSRPKTAAARRAFASDEDARQCRFQPKKTRAQLAAMKNPACGYDFVNHFDEDEAADDFIARMEAAESNRQKRLQVTRGEEEYSLRQNKKLCPRCGMTQSYAEFRDKKKRCTFCGVLFALPKAWGDVGHDFLERMESSVAEKNKRQAKIRDEVVAQETTANRVPKSATQRYYEKALLVKSHARRADTPPAFDL
ncbi:hypothetical protein ACHHYP_13643 [Achlya hypogyna]|uniref:Uncharacterized protein n=1 Tax=Achlya hypogyna TaxID=1202772 RepID=A0A1V9ZFP4_ACHHY|nr:hypothetical protein ACHHYP_13643 [Achlya hypogyna]